MPTSRATETPDLSRLVGLKLGNYRLERMIGRGRMGVVYLANDEALLRPTAIKLLSWRAGDAQGQDPVRWFLGEARMVACESQCWCSLYLPLNAVAASESDLNVCEWHHSPSIFLPDRCHFPDLA